MKILLIRRIHPTGKACGDYCKRPWFTEAFAACRWSAGDRNNRFREKWWNYLPVRSIVWNDWFKNFKRLSGRTL